MLKKLFLTTLSLSLAFSFNLSAQDSGGYIDLLSKNSQGKYTKHGWNHYGPGYFSIDSETGILTSHFGMGVFWYSAKQFKEAEWDEENKKYIKGDIVINYPDKPVWDDIPPGTDKQGWVDKTRRWDKAYEEGLRFKVGDIYKAIFK